MKSGQIVIYREAIYNKQQVTLCKAENHPIKALITGVVLRINKAIILDSHG